MGVNQKVSSYESTYNTSSTNRSTTPTLGRTPGGVTRHPTVKTPPPYRSPSPIGFSKHYDPDIEFGGKPHDIVDFTKKPAKPEPIWRSGEPNLEKFVPPPRDKFGSLDREPDRDRGTPTPTRTLDRFPPGGSKYYQPETVTNVEESYTTSKYDGMGQPTVTQFPGGKIVEYR